MTKILAFSGSTAEKSVNQKMVAIAAEGAKKSGAEVTLINLADYPMPLYNSDEEAKNGMPEHAQAFKKLLTESDGFLIASPEYNGAFTPLLKNVLDWASRPIEGEAPMQTYKGKTAAIMAASPGGLGGMRGLVMLRMLLTNLGVTALAEQQTLGGAYQAFDEDGGLADKDKQAAIEDLGLRLVDVCKK